jgi:hypothetical protein
VRERGIAESRRGGSADSSGDSIGEIDFVNNNIEALLSCPHANPKFSSETQMPGVQLSALALERPIAIAHRRSLRLIASIFFCFRSVNGAD